MSPLLLAVAAASTVLVVVAAWLMLRMAGAEGQFAARVGAARGHWAETASAGQARRRASGGLLTRAAALVGLALMRSGLIPGGTRTQLQHTLAASGFRGGNALAVFLGAKLVLVVAVPLAAWLLSGVTGRQLSTRLLMVGAAFVIGLLTPDRIISGIRKRYLRRLEDGLPDALDLMVICAQAGLSLEPAMVRVAAEMRLGQPEVAQELEQTVREIEVMADTQLALANLATRTGLPTLRRLVSTLVQTMQYGTPLTEALRTLSAETRQQALNRFESRAARLPVLLTLPMILFILPCVFIIVGGPAVIQVIRTVGH